MTRSDSSPPFMPASRLSAFSGRSTPIAGVDSTEFSRFSCMKFLSVRGVYDYAGPPSGSRSRLPGVLPSPSVHKVGAPNWFFEAQYPAHQCPCLCFAPLLTVSPRKTRGQDGSLLLSCETLSFSTSCRFIPALGQPPYLPNHSSRADQAGNNRELW
jgi:hypothetical protein